MLALFWLNQLWKRESGSLCPLFTKIELKAVWDFVWSTNDQRGIGVWPSGADPIGHRADRIGPVAAKPSRPLLLVFDWCDGFWDTSYFVFLVHGWDWTWGLGFHLCFLSLDLHHPLLNSYTLYLFHLAQFSSSLLLKFYSKGNPKVRVRKSGKMIEWSYLFPPSIHTSNPCASKPRG